MIGAASLRGLLLEEVVAFMLSESGYRLLCTPDDDPDALTTGPHGLLVRGRGADHQADALGELTVPVPFSLPTRLFAEAKYLKDPVGLEVARNAIGVINDVNERHERGRLTDLPPRRVVYRYALFSASGFARDTQSFALAQQISLVDLRGPAFRRTLDVIAATTEALLTLAGDSGLTSFPTSQLRTALRLHLGTWSAPAEDSTQVEQLRLADESRRLNVADEPYSFSGPRLGDLLGRLREDLTTELVLAFPDSPFVIVLQPFDLGRFDRFVREAEPEEKINIRYQMPPDGGNGQWLLNSEGDPDRPLASFGLPPLLETWLLAEGSDQRERASRLKRSHLSNLTVIRRGRTVRLSYTPFIRLPEDEFGATSDGHLTRLRRENRAPQQATSPVDTSPLPWSRSTIGLLLDALEQNALPHAGVIIAAAVNGGEVSRQEVYEIAERDRHQSLRGFTRPIDSTISHLVARGALPEGLERPLQPDPGRAAFFRVPGSIVAAFARSDAGEATNQNSP